MSGLHTLNKRIQYKGGKTDSRLNKGKLWSLKGALQNAYQSETAILGDNREFKCLINPDKIHMDYDNKVISIPYRDKCLNPEISKYPKDKMGEEAIGLKTGDVFTWKETNTHWLVTLQHLEESAYLRADIRKCDQEIEINGKPYWVYIRGPVETSIPWNQKKGIIWNDINYSLVMYITRDENTQDFFHRFTKIKITEPGSKEKKTWQVVAQNEYYGDNIIQVYLDEYYENSMEDAVNEENKQKPQQEIDKTKPYIEGPTEVTKYASVTYTAKNFTESGRWYFIKDGQEFKMNCISVDFPLNITKSKGNFEVEYRTINENAKLKVNIKAL